MDFREWELESAGGIARSPASAAELSLRPRGANCDAVAPGRAILGEIHGIMSTMSLITISCANKKLRTELEAKWKHTS